MNPGKQELRTAVRQRKKAMTLDEIFHKSNALCRMVLQSEPYRRSKTIYGYLPFNQEVQIFPLLQKALSDGKKVALPKCFGKDMRFILVSDLSRIQCSPFGAPEPSDDEPVASDETALVIVPGLVFDRHGYRIGYGGGYYDRFLHQEPSHPTIALCYAFQMVDQLNPEPHDVPIDTVFSL